MRLSLVNYAGWKRLQGSDILFSDDCNRADSATTPGAAYTVTGSLTYGIQSGKIYTLDVASALDGQAVHDVGTGNVDYSCDIVLRPSGSTDRGAAVVRSDGTQNNRWVVLMNSTTWATLRLLRYVGGTATEVATGALAAVTGRVYTVRVVAKGSALEVFIDGASTITASDPANAANTYIGVFTTRTINGASPTFDNLVVRRAA